MLVVASIASEFATGVGVLTRLIAVMGFVAQAYPALRRAPEFEIRQAVAIGGLSGFFIGIFVILLSAIGE
jgi:hypothetical protein